MARRCHRGGILSAELGGNERTAAQSRRARLKPKPLLALSLATCPYGTTAAPLSACNAAASASWPEASASTRAPRRGDSASAENWHSCRAVSGVVENCGGFGKIRRGPLELPGSRVRIRQQNRQPGSSRTWRQFSQRVGSGSRRQDRPGLDSISRGYKMREANRCVPRWPCQTRRAPSHIPFCSKQSSPVPRNFQRKDCR